MLILESTTCQCFNAKLAFRFYRLKKKGYYKLKSFVNFTGIIKTTCV